MLAVLLAALATAAVVVYVRGVKQQSANASGMVKVIVAKGDVPAGASLNDLIASGAFVTKSVPRNLIVQGAVTSVAQLRGKTAAQPILAGEQISTSRLMGATASLGGGVLGIPAGYVAVSLALPVPAEAGGVVARGDHVVVYASYAASGTDQQDVTVVLVPDVRVLKAQQPATTRGLGGSSSSNTTAILTLALRPADAQRLVFAQENGSVWLGLLPPGQAGTAEGPVTYEQAA